MEELPGGSVGGGSVGGGSVGGGSVGGGSVGGGGVFVGGRGVLLGGGAVFVGGGGVFVGGRRVLVGGSGVIVGGRGVLVGRGVIVGGRGVLVGRGVIVGVRGVIVGGRRVFVRAGAGVLVDKICCVVEGRVALGGRVRVDQVAMGDGEGLAVMEGVNVGEKVRLKTEVTEGVKVRVAVGEFVAVVKSVANASIVNIRSALRVAVGEPPVFGMIRSGSYNVPAVAFDAIRGMLNAITQAARRTINIKYSRIFNTVVPFLH